MKKLSRKDAQAQGRKKYYTGKLCMYGHDSQRYTSNTKCIECDKSPVIEAEAVTVGNLLKGFGIPPKR